jgi:hypothetical protein
MILRIVTILLQNITNSQIPRRKCSSISTRHEAASLVHRITVQPKPDDFKVTDMKWAIQQFTDWFMEAQEQVGPEVLLILLQYRILHCLEPEAMKNVVKHLKGTQSRISKHINNFRVNTKMAGAGQSYPMYLKFCVSTNVWGKDLTQLILDHKSVSPNISVWKSTLQKVDVVLLGWWKISHQNFDLTWITSG